MPSKAIEALLAATKPGADPEKVEAIWSAKNKRQMKSALAAMLKKPGVAATSADIAAIDEADADNILAAKGNIPTQGVVPLY